MKACELSSQFALKSHIENGLFIERHYEHAGKERAASGCIYYYVAPGERTEFHRIDCDEYWCHNAGSTLELWIIGLDGALRIERCGCDDIPNEAIGQPAAQPAVRLAAGEIFASRLAADADDGAFITCITVPRFSYKGFELLSKSEVVNLCAQAEAFWNDQITAARPMRKQNAP